MLTFWSKKTWSMPLTVLKLTLWITLSSKSTLKTIEPNSLNMLLTLSNLRYLLIEESQKEEESCIWRLHVQCVYQTIMKWATLSILVVLVDCEPMLYASISIIQSVVIVLTKSWKGPWRTKSVSALFVSIEDWWLSNLHKSNLLMLFVCFLMGTGSSDLTPNVMLRKIALWIILENLLAKPFYNLEIEIFAKNK